MDRRQFSGSILAGMAGFTLGVSGGFTNADPLYTRRTVAAFTKCLQFLDYEELGAVLAEVGFEGADLAVRPGGQVLPENVEKDLPKVNKALRKAGVSIPMIVTSIVDPDDSFTEPILRTAARLGIKHYRMGYLSYDHGKSIPENLEDFKGVMARLEKLNRKYKIKGEYQNHSGRRLGGPVWDLYPLLKELDPEFIGVQYDVCHATVEGGNSWLLGMKLVAPWIGSTDIKDFIWVKNAAGKWTHKVVPLGEGMVDWKTYLSEYRNLGISAPVSIHYEYDLGGAENGRNSTTMPLSEIKIKLQRDLKVLKDLFNQYEL